MLPFSEKASSLFNRPAIAVLCVAGLFFGALPSPGQSERAGGDRPKIGLERIDEAEGRARLEAFRAQRLEGDFVFRFELAHQPYRSSRTIRYRGIMWGAWNAQGPITRFRISPLADGSEGEAEPIEMIVQGGLEPTVWMRRGVETAFEELGPEALFDPVFEGIVFRPFDLQMPFVYWPEFRYEGPGRMGAYAAVQRFVMKPPEGSPAAAEGLSGVRLLIDDDYNALRRIEVLDTEGEVATEFSARGFKKVRGQYIVSEVGLKDERSRERTVFEVEAAALGQEHPRKWFDPSWKGVPEMPEPAAFEGV